MSNGERTTVSALTLAVCTRDRPADLRRCLESVASSPLVPGETLVSDDSAGVGTAGVVAAFGDTIPGLQLLEGPRSGLSANRNRCIDRASGSFLLFLDDDARLDAEFLRAAMKVAAADRIVTGFERHGPRQVWPHDPDFLGFQQRQPRALRTIVINSTIFPVPFLRRAWFDEFYRFGCEEMELAFFAVAHGVRIVVVNAGNHHDRSGDSRLDNDRNAIRSRACFGVRRFNRYEHRPWLVAPFVAYGLLNAVGAGLRQDWRAAADDGAAFISGVVAGARHRPRRLSIPTGV